jgi:CubicO group peptidase (beta-lactamase class C family)
MTRASLRCERLSIGGSYTGPWLLRSGCGFLPIVVATILSGLNVHQMFAAEPGKPDVSIEQRIQELAPRLEDYVNGGMKAFDVPGVGIGILAGDKLVYSKGYGVRSKGGQPVDPETLFQIASTTKAFLATTIAIAVDRKKLHWDDRVVDLDPDFQLKDPWVTREFRVFDLVAQRSGLPPYANDMLGILGFDENTMIHSLRYVEPVSSFRSSFGYTNITHVIAGRVVAKAEGASDWNAVLREELLDPLGMKNSSYTAAAIKAAPNHAEGYRYTSDGSVEVPFEQFSPYDFGGAGDINSNIEEMAHWVRLQLGNGSFEGSPIVSPENLAVTRTPKVGINDRMAYALGWIITQTPNGNVVWHNGGASGFGSYVGFERDKHIGVIILTNQGNVGFPDALGPWIFDQLLGNPPVDRVAEALKSARERFADDNRVFAKPANPRPFPALAPLTGNFGNPSFGKASLKHEGDVLVLELKNGAELKLEPWDGDIFTATLAPNGRFASVAANMGPRPSGFVQFQMDKTGKLNLLRLAFDDGQSYEFRRE